MSRTLEEILNTPVEFKVGQRVFSLSDLRFIKITHISHGVDYPARLLCESILENIYYTLDGKYHKDRAFRDLLTEQEAYELFPSLKPKVYEYRAIYKKNGEFRMTMSYIANENEFVGDFTDECEFVELYQPSKRERKS